MERFYENQHSNFQSLSVCPNCHLPARDASIRSCAGCRRIICFRCSVRLPNGAIICYRCAGTERSRFQRFVEGSNRATRAFFRFLFGPAWAP